MIEATNKQELADLPLGDQMHFLENQLRAVFGLLQRAPFESSPYVGQNLSLAEKEALFNQTMSSFDAIDRHASKKKFTLVHRLFFDAVKTRGDFQANMFYFDNRKQEREKREQEEAQKKLKSQSYDPNGNRVYHVDDAINPDYGYEGNAVITEDGEPIKPGSWDPKERARLFESYYSHGDGTPTPNGELAATFEAYYRKGSEAILVKLVNSGKISEAEAQQLLEPGTKLKSD